MIIKNRWKNLFQNLEHNYKTKNNVQMFILENLSSKSEADYPKYTLEDPNTIIIPHNTVTGNIKPCTVSQILEAQGHAQRIKFLLCMDEPLTPSQCSFQN